MLEVLLKINWKKIKLCDNEFFDPTTPVEQASLRLSQLSVNNYNGPKCVGLSDY